MEQIVGFVLALRIHGGGISGVAIDRCRVVVPVVFVQIGPLSSRAVGQGSWGERLEPGAVVGVHGRSCPSSICWSCC